MSIETLLVYYVYYVSMHVQATGSFLSPSND